jgi:hypothetical protein
MLRALRADQTVASERRWWETRAFMAALVLLSAVPLLWPNIPPLVDLPGHIGRYHVEMAIDTSPFLHRYYDFHWALIGNLGVDLLVIPLAKIVGLEPAVKIIVMLIPPLTIAGFLAVAIQAHGRLTPTAAFTVPIAYSYPFQFGFVNFAVSTALAFLALALWMRLGRMGRLRLRAALFVPISAAVWLCHTYGWGLLGLMAFAAELSEQRTRGRRWAAAVFAAAADCLPLTLPLLLMALWRSEVVGGLTGNWFNLVSKFWWLVSVFREQYRLFDVASLCALLLLLIVAAHRSQFRWNRSLSVAAALFLACFLLMPRIVFGSAYADMRIVPFMIALAVLAVTVSPSFPRAGTIVAAAGCAFAIIRLTATTLSFVEFDSAYDRTLKMLQAVPRGARLVTLVDVPCWAAWRSNRLQHLPGMAIARRDAFSNGQWRMPGAALLSVKYQGSAPFTVDPSQIVPRDGCPRDRREEWSRTLSRLPIENIDQLWLIGYPYEEPVVPGLKLVKRDGANFLYGRRVTTSSSIR